MKEQLNGLINNFVDWVEKVGNNFSNKEKLNLFYNTLDDEKPLINIDFSEDSIYYFGLGNILSDKNIDKWDEKNINNKRVAAQVHNLLLTLYLFGDQFLEKANKKIINGFFNFYNEYYILYDWIATTKYNLEKVKIYKFDNPDFIIETENEIIPVEVTLSEGDRYSQFFLENQNLTTGLASLPPKIENYEGITEKDIKNITKHLKNNNLYKENIEKHFFNKKIVDTLYLIPLGSINRIFNQEILSIIKIIIQVNSLEINLENVFFRIYQNNGWNSKFDGEIWNSLEKIKWIVNLEFN